MKNPLIMEFISRESWAMTSESFEALLRIASGTAHLESEMIFHGALGDMEDVRVSSQDGDAAEYRFGQRHGKVGVVRIEGPIVPRPGMEGASQPRLTTAAEVQSDIASMESDSSIEKIVLVIDSPGGAVTGIAELAAQIRASEKPVAAYVFGYCASAAFWIASAADEIISSKTGSIGSVGVVATISTRKDKDVVQIVSSQSPKKRVDAYTEDGLKHYQARVDDLADIFIEEIASNRTTTREDVMKNYGEGDVVIASRALAAGMIDGISTFADFMKTVAACNPKKRREQKNKKGIDGTSTVGAESGQQGEAIASIGAKKMGDLNQLLAADPEAKSAFDKAIAAAESAGIEKAKAELERTNAETRRCDIAFAAKIASSLEYPQMVRDLAAKCLTGEASRVELMALVAVSDMERERAKSEEAKRVQSAATPGQQHEASDDGIVNASNFKGAAARLREMRGV